MKKIFKILGYISEKYISYQIKRYREEQVELMKHAKTQEERQKHSQNIQASVELASLIIYNI